MRIQLLTGIVLAVTFVGCGGGPNDQAELAPIEGVALLDGVPISKPVVTFYPESGPAGVGVGNEQGEFKIKTNGANGAPVGKCKVTVVSPGAAGEVPAADGNEAAMTKTSTLNVKYSSKDTTDLVIEVTKEGDTSVKLELEKQ